MELHSISLTVNGQPFSGEVEPRLLLSDYLRHELELTGTHVGCEHGVCGACTVLLDGQPVRIEGFDPAPVMGRKIVTGRHCFGCTAGAGSSCGGAIHDTSE